MVSTVCIQKRITFCSIAAAHGKRPNQWISSSFASRTPFPGRWWTDSRPQSPQSPGCRAGSASRAGAGPGRRRRSDRFPAPAWSGHVHRGRTRYACRGVRIGPEADKWWSYVLLHLTGRARRTRGACCCRRLRPGVGGRCSPKQSLWTFDDWKICLLLTINP